MTLPQIKYLLPSTRGFVPADDAMCRFPMRLTRNQTCEGWADRAMSYGQYFRAITQLISKDGFRHLAGAAAGQLAEDISLADIEEILIYVEKHGSDYHPARIEVMVNNEACATFVMNVAVTARGKARMSREFEVLQHLNSKYDFSFLPRVYFQGEASCDSEQGGETGTPLLMFLADWFQGYYEFHLSIDKGDGRQRLVLWETDQEHRCLAQPQIWKIYSQAAMILTLYYDIETFEQIFPWHHAAGDFVVRAEHDSLDVRLVTARQYAPMVEPSQGVSVHEALLLFLLNLSLRTRLDRLDGVGAVAWADDECVGATLHGFAEGLRIKQRRGYVDKEIINGFLQYVDSIARGHVADGFHALVDACDQSAPDVPVIRQHLDGHIHRFYLAVQESPLIYGQA